MAELAETDLSVQADLPKNLAGVFAEPNYLTVPQLSFVGEMDGHNINLGAKYDINKFSIKAGMLGFDEAIKCDSPNTRIALSVSYLFDSMRLPVKRPMFRKSCYQRNL
jgi:hypothetical protein